ncbi:PilZ domain-containing protein [Glaciecola petra]|uniref:PilZ domain-containing protein n=1 Tax=Glaciecola petra TaxID=3075602 RepID=A0ABU2ZNJ0_9ALTE|nr:PilZ domain-containing protein [Aestuariibacter sp. P117]MDT0594198.1 PilZ domain-containing protein [Aestuariibacter sp. P117]
MLSYDDKRNFYRMMVNSPCQVELLDQNPSLALTAICKDISATGMSLEMESEAIEIGALLQITVDSNNDQIPSLVAKAKVVRCEEQDSDTYLVGVEISEMN